MPSEYRSLLDFEGALACGAAASKADALCSQPPRTQASMAKAVTVNVCRLFMTSPPGILRGFPFLDRLGEAQLTTLHAVHQGLPGGNLGEVRTLLQCHREVARTVHLTVQFECRGCFDVAFCQAVYLHAIEAPCRVGGDFLCHGD